VELRQYLDVVRRWAWLLVLGLVLGIIVGVLISVFQTPVYQTSTQIMVNSSSSGAASNPYSIYTDQQLAQTYVLLLTTQPILDGSSEVLGYPVSASQITPEQVEGSQIIEITVEDFNPQHATDIANQLVHVLIEQNSKLQTGQYAISDESLQEQIKQVEDAMLVTKKIWIISLRKRLLSRLHKYKPKWNLSKLKWPNFRRKSPY